MAVAPQVIDLLDAMMRRALDQVERALRARERGDAMALRAHLRRAIDALDDALASAER